MYLPSKQFSSLVLATSVATGAVGQALENNDTQEQRRRNREQATQRERVVNEPRVDLQRLENPPAPDATTASATDLPGSTALPQESPCFVIDRFVLEVPEQLSAATRALGASALPMDPFRFAQEALNHYQGACIGPAGVNLIVQRLTRTILERGYSTTRLGIPRQDLSTGTLTLTLVPGVIHAIRFTDPDTDASWRSAFPTDPGQLLSLPDIEQGLEQMKRVPSQQVEMEIVPADAPGESDIVITVQRDTRWKVSASLDDSGAKSTGKLQSGVNLAIDNPLGLNDLFNLSLNTDADRQGQQRGTNGNSLYYAIPWGYWNWSVAASSYRYHQQIAGIYQTFVSSGQSRNLDLTTQRLFYRDQQQKHTLQLKLGKRWSRSFIDNSELDVQRRNTTSVELAWLQTHYFGNAQLNLTLANRWGAAWFNGQSDVGPRSSDSPTYHYSLQTLDASLYALFQLGSQRVSYNATLRAQHTRSALFQSEQIAIGNRYTVRGFDGEQTLTAERGFYLRNEVEMPLAQSRQRLYLGIDAGRVFGANTQNLLGTKLAGAAIGMRGTIDRLYYDVFVASPLVKPDGFRTTMPVTGFTLHYQY